MREVSMGYKEACTGYAIGYACAFFMASTVVAYVLIFQSYANITDYTSLAVFIIFSIGGSSAIAIAYLWPVGFYELIERE